MAQCNWPVDENPGNQEYTQVTVQRVVLSGSSLLAHRTPTQAPRSQCPLSSILCWPPG